MPVPDQRDPEITRAKLEGWLSGRLAGATGVRVPHVQTPTTTGFSAETLIFDAEWAIDGQRRSGSYVAKVAPTGFQLLPEPRFGEQYKLLQILASNGVQVPAVHWYEPGPGLLGAPFYVMGRLAGEAPTDMPPYHQDGWVTAASPEVRERLWWHGLDVLAQIHALDVDALGLGFVDQPAFGRAGIEQRLGYYEHFLSWGYEGTVPVADAALRWLRENRPPEPEPPILLWGDARIGNIMYDDGVPTGVLDWEMATLGQPEEDLAWFLHLDKHHSEGVGADRLPGFPTAAETIARYERLAGRPMRNMDYYEVLSGFKFTVIMARIGQLFIHYDLIPAGNDFPANNTASQLLAKIMGLPPPGGELTTPTM